MTADPNSQLKRASERDAISDGSWLAVLEEYVEDFLGRPHPDLGIPDEPNRHVCPFVRGAIAKDTLYLSVHRGATTADQAERVIAEYHDLFDQLEPRQGPQVVYKAIVAIFPDVLPGDAAGVIDETQRRLKNAFVPEGLMVGEFHPNNGRGGLHNPAFYPLRSPYPLLAIRVMVPEDLPFLIEPYVTPQDEEFFRKPFLRTIVSMDSAVFRPTKARMAFEATQATLRRVGYEAWPRYRAD